MTWQSGTRWQDHAKKSLVQLLGGVDKPIPAYGAIGYDGVKGSARVAEAWEKQGFRGVKAKIGTQLLKKMML